MTFYGCPNWPCSLPLSHDGPCSSERVRCEKCGARWHDTEQHDAQMAYPVKGATCPAPESETTE